MKILVTGVNGQLGYDVINELLSRGHDCFGTDIKPQDDCKGKSPIPNSIFYKLDITDRDAVFSLINLIKPEAVIHCAAWTAVDLAEEKSNIEVVYRINVEGTRNISEACESINAKILYLSTDYVFDGNGTDAWQADNNNFNPVNTYGKSKLDGEIAIASTATKYFIVRIAWVFGLNGNNFIKTMLKLAETHSSIKVVNDQIGTPTYTYDLARLLVDLIESNKYGYYHATNEGGYISWYDFACEIFKQAHLDISVIPVSTTEYGLSKATRPFNSRLDKRKLIDNQFEPLPDWRDALARFLHIYMNK